MSDQRKVFLSYRRSLSGWLARSVYQWLRGEGFDVFMDVENLDSGQFPDVILHQIEARPHFVVALIPGTLQRTVDKGDWLCREIEHAIRQQRNIVPLLADNFSFAAEERTLAGKEFPPTIKELSQQSGINVPNDYFDAAMGKLRDRFLKERMSVAIKPAPDSEKNIVERMTMNATLADAKPSTHWWQWSTTTSLAAPKLRRTKHGLNWTRVRMAMGYVLQRGTDELFTNPVDVYDGAETVYPDSSGFWQIGWFLRDRPQYYRVKARGSHSFSDSPWSNVVVLEPTEKPETATAFKFVPYQIDLDAPVIKADGNGWKWTAVGGASGYVLEASSSADFSDARTVYDGPHESYSLPTARLLLEPGLTFLRVKAKGAGFYADSRWSNVVEILASI